MFTLTPQPLRLDVLGCGAAAAAWHWFPSSETRRPAQMGCNGAALDESSNHISHRPHCCCRCCYFNYDCTLTTTFLPLPSFSCNDVCYFLVTGFH